MEDKIQKLVDSVKTTNMKEFIPYEQALELKELGFNEPCLGYYDNFNIFIIDRNSKIEHKNSIYSNNELYKGVILAPLYQQAFKWFREKYGLHQYIKQYCGESFYFHIEDMVHPRRFDEYTVEMLRSFNESTSQEEAELACLIKLIEICKK